MKFIFSVLFATIFFSPISAQSIEAPHKKGDFSFYWGYNRAAFTTSDITYVGPGYDFTLQDVVAFDRPTAFEADVYFGLTTVSIPQYVYRIGYFVNSHWSVSVGVDHMKYVMPENLTLIINGTINQPNNPYNGVYSNSQIFVADTFLTFEHTDGLNYVNLGADYFYEIYTNKTGSFSAELIGGGGLGALIPKSNVTLMNGTRNDEFHFAGYGLHANAGFQLNFWRHLFFRTQAKAGFIHMPDILTTPGDVEDRASQHFWFAMWDFALGAQWHF